MIMLSQSAWQSQCTPSRKGRVSRSKFCAEAIARQLFVRDIICLLLREVILPALSLRPLTSPDCRLWPC